MRQTEGAGLVHTGEEMALGHLTAAPENWQGNLQEDRLVTVIHGGRVRLNSHELK